jgi:hypothetical protein
MTDPIAITSIIVAIGTMIGGAFGYFHFRLNSNCCSCCKFECSENDKLKKKTPPDSPIILQPIKKEIVV